MPAAKLMNFRERIMRPPTKNSWLRHALAFTAIIVPIVFSTANAQSPIAPKKWVVVIDAGHGGKDPGCIGTAKTKEKSIALAIALRTGAYINQYLPDVKVIYTRDDDTFIGLYERADVANSNNADFFISVHANAVNDKRPKGVETYILGQSMDDENLKVAMKENSVITYEDNYQTKYEGYDPTSAESFIIFSMMQNTYVKQSTEFASLVQKQFTERVGRYDRGVKQAGYLVLWRTTMPSVLVEVGFLSNVEEEKYLNTVEAQEYLSSAIYRAFRQYKQTIDSRSGISSAVAPVNDLSENTVTGNALSENVPSEKLITEIKPETKPEEKKNEKQTIPGEIWFSVQIASSPKNKPDKSGSLKGVEKVTILESGERYKYVAGKFYNYDDASSYRKKISDLYPDAFVIAVKDKTIISLKAAIEEKKKLKQ
jgi:N-acetylmuramoyl-L-alanine amidase